MADPRTSEEAHHEAVREQETSLSGCGLVLHQAAPALLSLISTLPDEEAVFNGQQIACAVGNVAGGDCAFLQNVPAGEALASDEVKSLAQDIVNYGCQIGNLAGHMLVDVLESPVGCLRARSERRRRGDLRGTSGGTSEGKK
ncbi:hypothetical protein B0T24DRAFT_661731 [Lasiosphaeria ovina]|uniref:Killer toxin Kp4 domain-containing protein n=1 Tax=Lasiosphaeria ovina TaxID=92902 RepID=A0AAE0NKD6_9PEZI|nr:hypothetical protein B0T24DRAFT_661731 [Lasiosphaeria ovina]